MNGMNGMNLEDKIKTNTWDEIQDFIEVLQMMRDGRWDWTKNPACKYVRLDVDMRDGRCIMMDRDGNRIDKEMLAHQF